MTTPNSSTLRKPGGRQNDSRPSPYRARRRGSRGRYFATRLSFLFALLVMGLAIFSSIPNSTSANLSKKDWSKIQPDSALQLMLPNPAGKARVSETRGRDNSLLRKLTRPVDFPGGLYFNLLLPQAPAGESIATFAEDCTTPKTDFNFGETICAVVSNAPLGANERLVWGHTDGFLARETMIASATQSDSLLLTPTSIIGGVTVNNSGTWVISSIDVDGAPVATTKFTIHDPELLTADLAVYKFPESGESKVNENTDVRFTISVSNFGPDAATEVELTDLVPDATTFVSLTQDGPSTFTCSGSTCTIATLPRGTRANFTAVYHTNGVAAQTLTTYSATVTSDTNELRAADNSATGELSIVTVGAPVACTLACPDNINATANTTVNGQRGAMITFDAAEPVGDCGAVTATPASGSFFPVGTTPVTVNSATGGGSCSFTVTVEDTGGNPATISCPAGIETNANANCEASITLAEPTTGGDNVTVTGVRSDGKSLYNCDVNGVCTRKSVDDPFAAGTTTITWTAFSHSTPGPFATAEDEEAARTGSASCTQTITVNDVTAPVIAVSPQTIAADASCQAVIPDFTTTATVSDNCACSGSDESEACADRQPITVTQSPAPGTPVGLGAHPITLTANDGSSNNNGAGNTTTTTTTFTVADQTAPVVTAPADSSASADASCQVAIPDYVSGSTVSDSCDANPTVTQSPAAGTLVGLGSHTVTVTATDAAGNHSSDTVVFTVNDETDPVISCPSDIEVFLPANSNATSMAVTYPAATATDNCSTPTITYSHASGSTFPVGTTTVTATATDAAGNHSECTFDVTVRYVFTGFFSPVSNAPTLNAVNAGRAIPVKFSLSGDKGLNIFAPNNPYTVSLNCSTSDPGVDVTETLTAGGSSLSFGGGQYNYVWKTEPSWAGTCRQLVITLNDGSVHVANFKFK
jgi:uncharacterized repeat protein (TIGR01451 family)